MRTFLLIVFVAGMAGEAQAQRAHRVSSERALLQSIDARLASIEHRLEESAKEQQRFWRDEWPKAAKKNEVAEAFAAEKEARKDAKTERERLRERVEALEGDYRYWMGAIAVIMLLVGFVANQTRVRVKHIEEMEETRTRRSNGNGAQGA